MYTIQANPSGTRSIEVSSENLKTIEKYALFRHLAAQGITGQMVIIQRTGSEPYQVSYGSSPVCDIANQVKSVPKAYINAAGNDVTPEILSYLRPLIQGQPKLAFDQGIPRYLPVPHLYA